MDVGEKAVSGMRLTEGCWKALEHDAGVLQRWFVYGNYIDEALMMVAACLEQGGFAHRLYYIQDGLYSTRTLVADKGWVIEEQTYYDVYGRAGTWTSGDADADGDIDGDDVNEFSANFFKSECDAGYNWRCDVDNSGVVNTTDWPAFNRNGSTPANQQSYFTNPYYFTGRRVDFLDNGNLKLQHNRHRYYDYYMGRWVSEDPLNYWDGLNLYAYVENNPTNRQDPVGLWRCCPDKCKAGEMTYQVLDSIMTPYHVAPTYRHAVTSSKAARRHLSALTLAKIVVGLWTGQSAATIVAEIGSAAVTEAVVRTIDRAFSRIIAKLSDEGAHLYLKVELKECRKERCCVFFKRYNWQRRTKYHPCAAGSFLDTGVYNDPEDAAGHIWDCKMDFRNEFDDKKDDPSEFEKLFWPHTPW